MDSREPQLSSVSLLSLPVEILRVLFSHLSEAISLQALILTCSSFYHIFKNAESKISTEVLLNELDEALFYEVSAVIASAPHEAWSKERTRDFLRELQRDKPISRRWSLSDILTVSKLHQRVQFFAVDFSLSARAANPIGGSVFDVDSSPLSSSELRRIERTFYYFELYCNLFREGKQNDGRFDETEQREVFFSKFSPWQNEQLSCIHQYLFRSLSVAFNDVAEHDVYWGEYSVSYTNDWDENPYKEHFLSLGLEYLHQIINAKTYDQRHELLSSKFGVDDLFLQAGLKDQEEDDDIPFSEYSHEKKEKISKSFFVADDDHDLGPFEAWAWAHADSSSAYFYFADEHRELREWGYVMWDSERLTRWNPFHQEWVRLQKPIDAEGHKPFDAEGYKCRAEGMASSFKARSEIYRRGGKGWWALGDETKIRWS